MSQTGIWYHYIQKLFTITEETSDWYSYGSMSLTKPRCLNSKLNTAF